MTTLLPSWLCRCSHHHRLGFPSRLNSASTGLWTNQVKNNVSTVARVHLCATNTLMLPNNARPFFRHQCHPTGATQNSSIYFPHSIRTSLSRSYSTFDDSNNSDGHTRMNESKVEEELATSRVKEILRGVYNGEKAKLAEAITLVESKHPVKHRQAQWLLTNLLSQRSKQLQLGTLKPTYRIGLSGPPGAGKSTFIETFGLVLIEFGYKIGVLAVDPSSSRTGGSIMGDKTRMPRLTREPNAYIRPSPSGGTLGGVTRNTNEAIMLCEGAGFDVILVETVGVGQSETAVCDMVDMFVLIIPPAAGDELQGLKKGIVELCDLILINKADGDLLPAARRIQAEYVSALKLVRSKHKEWNPKVVRVSALHGDNIAKSWEVMQSYFKKMMACGEFYTKRKQQQRKWLWNHIDWELGNRFRCHPGMAGPIATMEGRVMAGSMAPGTAADVLLDTFIKL
ncbi:methylmalonic aciduria type A homolog, mitochondrial-like [Halichondria panicea]|uniref:methylmalonic aciduria type A homolog, mitochondrial-like n=1 Tax=Halichondria panicea TaxID=6063 RepID=UPI00312B6BB1